MLVPIATNIPIELSPASPVLPKTSAMEHLPSNETIYIQHQIDLLRQELENNIAANNDLKTLSMKNVRMKNRRMLEKENADHKRQMNR